VLSTVGDDLLMAIAQPTQADDMSHEYLATLVERLLQDPPQGWDEEKKMSLAYAVQMHYQHMNQQIPGVVESKLILVELTDGSNSLVKLVKQAGPQGTATVEACKEVLALAETRDISYQQVAAVLLYLALSTGYNAKNFVAALREHRTGQRIDWQDVVLAFDRDHLRIETHQFLAIYHALLPVAQDTEKFDIQALWGGSWQHELTQLYFVVAFLSTTQQELDVTQIPRLRTSYSMKTFDGAPEDAKSFAQEAVKHPFVSLDATAALFSMIFQTSDTYHTAQVMGIPDRVINPHTAEFLVAAAAVPKPWGALQEQALKQLFDPYFHKKLPIYNFVLCGLWQQDLQWLVDRFVDAYNADSMTLTLIIEHAETNKWLEPLIRSNTDISLDLAAQAHARGKFDIEPWLQQTFDQAGPLFRRILTNFLSARAAEETTTSLSIYP
jgi:CCR4-NOT transcription complex subunit 1